MCAATGTFMGAGVQMRNRIALCAAAFAVVGCSGEYDIVGDVEAFGEPNPPALENPEQTDRIVQVTTPAGDVLWVVDNSGSRSDNQRALAEQTKPTKVDHDNV